MSFLTALKFLTILPLPYRGGDRPEDIGRAVVFFPLAGLVIGLILAGLQWLLGLVLPLGIVNGLLIAALAALSGALHLDGFMDTCDGIAGHKPVEERWQVMHDSRVGAFGVVGVVLLLLVKYITLNSIPTSLITASLIIMPVVSRWVMVYALFAYPYARPQGLGAAMKTAVNRRRFAGTTVICLAVVLLTTWLAGLAHFLTASLIIMGGIWVIILVTAAYFKRMFSGLTGDTYGAINEIAELGALVLITVLLYNQWLV